MPLETFFGWSLRCVSQCLASLLQLQCYTMAKIGRNQTCPCGSGKKYKHCCGSHAAQANSARTFDTNALEAAAQAELGKHEAREHRRRLIQGLGRPIISLEHQGYRVVIVGNEVRYSKSWRTFHDFLLSFIKQTLTPEWGRTELNKPEADRHPMMAWVTKAQALARAEPTREPDEVRNLAMTGAVRAYLGLAYDLYLSAHNAELADRLIIRLRNRDQFEGALHEAYVIGNFAKAGFTIEFENEDDASQSHCEFVATHCETGRQFSVEAKTVTSASTRAGASELPAKVRNHLYNALKKESAHPRIIFIELNRAHRLNDSGQPEWLPHVREQIAACEQELTIAGEPPPPAYVFVTNRSFVHDLDGTSGGEAIYATGFKIGDFPAERGATRLLDMVDAREKHIEIHWLLKAMQRHHEIPTTFDDRLPEEAFGAMPEGRLQIGESYLVSGPDGQEVEAVLEGGVVLEHEKKAYCTYRSSDGHRFMCSSALSDEELAVYRRSPETFFGELRQVGRGVDGPLDAYDFIFDTYSKSTREALLGFMKDWPDIDDLSKLDQTQLARQYAARIGTQMWSEIARGVVSAT